MNTEQKYEILVEYYAFCKKHNLISNSFIEFIERLYSECILDEDIFKLYCKKKKKIIDNTYKRVKKDNIKINDCVMWFSKGELKKSKVIKILPTFLKIQDFDPITKGKLNYERKLYLFS